jgi:deazaflavin-dependent oxidoreductase (nitroreductase family)
VLGPALRRSALSGPFEAAASRLGSRGETIAAMDDIGEQLTSWGKVARLEVRGRTTGTPLSVAVGYLDQPDASILVAAGEPEADWALNLELDPRCRATIGDRTVDMVAERLEGLDASSTVVGLILKYGTTAERLGRGPVFRLRPIQP